MNFQKRVVHIGCFVHMPGAISGPEIEEGTKYFCFELEDRFKNNILEHYNYIPEVYKSQVDLIFKSARNTGLQSESIDEVHMYNVIGDPEVKKLDELFEEAHRILKPQKSLFIGETLTPFSMENLIILSRRNAFSLEVIVPHPLERVREEEVKRFYEILKENVNNKIYNKNFSEYYKIFHRMGLAHDNFLNEQEKQTFAKYSGNNFGIGVGAYLVRLIKE